jgi:hypothetical protein
MSVITVVVFDVSFIAERWLRHTGRLAHNTSTGQKALSILTIICAIGGAAGLILLSIFDTVHHSVLHNCFLCLFIGGYILSAIFICWEYQRLGVRYREFRILAASFWVKLFFILLELALVIAFGVSSKLKHWNIAAILEWVIALVYTFFVLSFFMDFVPAVHGHGHGKQSHETEEQMAAMGGGDHGAHHANGAQYAPGRHYAHNDGHTNGTNGYAKQERYSGV